MYPPSDEPDEVRIARNQAQARWIAPIAFLAGGLVAVCIRGWRSVGVCYLAAGTIDLACAFLERRSVSKIWLRTGSITAYVCIFVLYRLLGA